jgi:hypothetical protein
MAVTLKSFVNWIKSPIRAYPLVLLLFYVVLGFAYFSAYVPHHRRQLDDQALRMLQSVGDRIGSHIEDLSSIVQTQAERQTLPDPKFQQLPAELGFAPPCDVQVMSGVAPSLLTLRPWAESGRVVFRWVYKLSPNEIADHKKATGKSLDGLCAQVAFENDIAPFIRGLFGGPFEQVALALDDGTVVISEGKIGVSIADFTRFLAAQRPTLSELTSTPTETKKGKPTSKDDEMARLSNFIELASRPGSRDAKAATSTLDWIVQGHHYLLLMQPVTATVATLYISGQTDSRFKLTLIGIVDPEGMDRSAKQLPVNIWANLLIIFLCAIVLGGTLLKFFYAGPGEAIRNYDLVLFFCAMCCVSAMGSILLFLDVNRANDKEVDTRMQTLAMNIQDNFRKEVQSVLDLLDILPTTGAFAEDRKHVTTAASSANRGKRHLVYRMQVLTGKSKCKILDQARPEHSSDCGESSEAAQQLARVLFHYYPWLDNVFWSAPNGEQVLKWTVKSQITGQIDASKYEWYQKLIRGETWTLSGPSNPASRREFAFDTIFSPNTGEYFAVILTSSRRADKGGNAKREPIQSSREPALETSKRSGPELPIIAAGTPMISLAKPIVPPGYGFAIIDTGGIVRFHSKPERNLRENFLTELGSRRQLSLSSTSIRSFEFEDTYHGIATRFHVQRMPIVGSSAYSLIVYRDLEDRDNLYQRAFLITFQASLVYGLLLLGAVKLSVWLGQKVWNRRELRLADNVQDKYSSMTTEQATAKRRRSFAGAVMNLRSTGSLLYFVAGLEVCGILLWWRTFRHSPNVWDLLFLGLILAMAVILFPLLALVIEPGEVERRPDAWLSSPVPTRWHFIGAFTVAAFLAAYVFGCIPVIMMTRSAFRLAGIPYRMRALSELADELESRADAARAYYAKVPNNEYRDDPSVVTASSLSGSPAFLAERLHTRDDIFLQEWMTYKISGDEKECQKVPTLSALWMLPDWPLNYWDATRLKDSLLSASFHACLVGNRLLLFLHPPHKQQNGDGRAASRGFDSAELPQRSQVSWRGPIRLEATLPFMPFGIGRLLVGSAVVPLVCAIVFSFVLFAVLRVMPGRRPLLPSMVRLFRLFVSGPDDSTLAKQNWFFIAPPSLEFDQLQWTNVGIQHIELGTEAALSSFQVHKATRLVVLTSFESGLQRERADQTLRLLNQLLANPHCKVWILSSINPLTYFLGSVPKHRRAPSEDEEKDLKRCEGWVNAMVAFELAIASELQDAIDSDDNDKIYFLWSHCTGPEKLALWQIVQFGFANRVNQSAVNQLAGRLLAFCNSDSGRMNAPRKLDELILRSSSIRQEGELLLESRVDTTWQGFKWTILVTAIAGGLFLLTTESESATWSNPVVALASLGGVAAALKTAIDIATSLPIRKQGRLP